MSYGITLPAVLYGGVGEDSFFVYSNHADLRLEGEDDNDEFVIRAFALSPDSNIKVNGGGGDDTIEYNVNAPVDIDGGAGFDTVVVLGTEFDDVFVVTEDGVYGAGLTVRMSNAESMEVDGLEGDDTFYVLSTNDEVVTTLIGGLGSDTFNVAGDVTLPVVAASRRHQRHHQPHGRERRQPLSRPVRARHRPDGQGRHRRCRRYRRRTAGARRRRDLDRQLPPRTADGAALPAP